MDNMHIRRIIAFLIDMSAAGIIARFFENFFSVTFKINDLEVFGLHFTLFVTLIPLFYWVYLMVFDIVTNGRTIGKLLLNIVTVSKTGEKLSTKQCLVRSLYKMISIMILPVSILLFLFKDHYTIQDRYSGTITIKSNSK